MPVTLKVWTSADKTDCNEYTHPDLDTALLTLNSYNSDLTEETAIFWPHGFTVVADDGAVLLDITYPI